MLLRRPNLLIKRMPRTKRLFALSPPPKQTHKYCTYMYTYTCRHLPLGHRVCWAEARIKIARMTLTIKLDRNWSSFQLANSAPPLSVTDSVIAPFRKDDAMVYQFPGLEEYCALAVTISRTGQAYNSANVFLQQTDRLEPQNKCWEPKPPQTFMKSH